MFAVTGTGFGADTGQQIGRLVILRVGPFFHRMVVAFGAIDRHAKERLRDGLRHRSRVVMEHIEICRSIVHRAALGDNDLARETVPRGIGRDVKPNPIVIRPHRRSFKLFAADQQKVGPFVGPVIDEFGPPKKRLDHLVAFTGSFIRKKITRFLRGWQNAGRIQESAAKELFIAAARRRRQVQVLELFQNKIIDKTSPFRVGKYLRLDCIGERDGD